MPAKENLKWPALHPEGLEYRQRGSQQTCNSGLGEPEQLCTSFDSQPPHVERTPSVFVQAGELASAGTAALPSPFQLQFVDSCVPQVNPRPRGSAGEEVSPHPPGVCAATLPGTGLTVPAPGRALPLLPPRPGRPWPFNGGAARCLRGARPRGWGRK